VPALAMARRLPRSLKVLARANGVDSTIRHCEALLGASGHSIGVALASQTLASYRALTPEQRADFFLALLSRFSPDPAAVLAAAKRYADQPSPAHLWALEHAAEPPRQELLRRLNRAPGGTAAILKMREHLIECILREPQLEAVDLDFHHLLSSWFNEGFLQLVHLNWRTPAEVLERIVQHERVHQIQDWQDLRHRLQDDRRCFAFFHPALPGEPLIFVEVAFVDEMPAAVAPILALESAVGDPRKARCAVFYSITSTQEGLRGISFGNFLIKGVAEDLRKELPNLKLFATLSPIPGLKRWVEERAGRRAEEAGAIEKLAAFYLTREWRGDQALDPVARFHLGNGARLERINPHADGSPRGESQAFGLMVNYVYDLDDVERNHEEYVNRHKAACSSAVERLAREGEALLEPAPATPVASP
jgi:malonyl-CoA decarboxylase